MSSLRNNVRLIGHLGMDPEYKKFESGKEVVRFRLATSENYRDKDGNWQTETQWHNIVCWNNVAGRVVNNLQKGSYITLEGSLNYRNYKDANGSIKYITEIRMDSYIAFDKNNTNISIPNQTSNTEKDTDKINIEMVDDDLPF